jgi:hypothetical protein
MRRPKVNQAGHGRRVALMQPGVKNAPRLVGRFHRLFVGKRPEILASWFGVFDALFGKVRASPLDGFPHYHLDGFGPFAMKIGFAPSNASSYPSLNYPSSLAVVTPG